MFGAALLVVAVALGIVVAVTHGDIALDRAVLDGFIAVRSNLFTAILGAITVTFSTVATIVLTALLAAAALLLTRRWQDFVYVALCQIMASAITHILKFMIGRERPPEASRLVVEITSSFPSGHTTAATAFAISAAIVLTGFIRARKAAWATASTLSAPSAPTAPPQSSARALRVAIWIFAIVIVVTIAITRMYLAAHWFTDVTAGACVGAGSALVLSAIPRLEQVDFRRSARVRA